MGRPRGERRRRTAMTRRATRGRMIWCGCGCGEAKGDDGRQGDDAGGVGWGEGDDGWMGDGDDGGGRAMK